MGDPSADQHLWHRDAKNKDPADQGPSEGSLHTLATCLCGMAMAIFALYFTFQESSRINTASRLFELFNDLFWTRKRILCDPRLKARVEPPLLCLCLYSSLKGRFLIPLPAQCQHCGGSHSSNIYPPFAHAHTHSAQTLSGFSAIFIWQEEGVPEWRIRTFFMAGGKWGSGLTFFFLSLPPILLLFLLQPFLKWGLSL